MIFILTEIQSLTQESNEICTHLPWFTYTKFPITEDFREAEKNSYFIFFSVTFFSTFHHVLKIENDLG